MAEQLCMLRPDLNDLPEVNLPPGFSERCYQDGDAAAWCAIITESFEDPYDEQRFVDYMQGDAAYRPQRIRFICDADGVPCATTSGYRREKYGADSGYVHMVGVLKRAAGNRLGYWISLRVLHLFKEEGCRDAVLQTDDFRLPAIKTYLNLGFEPLLVAEDQQERWQRVYSNLKLEAPLHWRRKEIS